MDHLPIDELIEKYAAGTASAEELQQLLEWYRSADIGIVEWPAESPDEKASLQQRMLQRLEHGMQGASTASPDDPFSTKDAPPTIIPLPRFRSKPWLRAAACLAIVAAAWIIGKAILPKTDYISVKNASGKVQFVRLPDSSQVWLNAESSIRYAATFTRQRELFLEGEGYFDVPPDKGHPFVVHAGALTTTVLGTAFNIKAFSNERENAITVIRGKVQVQDSTKVLDVLTPARQLQWDARTRQAQTVTVDTSLVAAWQHGKFQFNDQTLEEITATLGRWYHVRFVFASPVLKSCRMRAVFDNSIQLRKLLELFSTVNDMKFTIDDNTHIVTLSGKGC